MKCTRCGKEVANNVIICDNCGFNFTEHKQQEKYLKNPVDPDVPVEQRASLVDNPVLTLIFGSLSIMFSLLFIIKLVVLYLIIMILMVFITFYLSAKPSKVKLRPLRNVGIAMAYIAIGFILFIFAYKLIGLLF